MSSICNMAQTLSTEEEKMKLPKTIIKSSGTSEPFDLKKLEFAIVQSLDGGNDELRQIILDTVLERIEKKNTTSTHYINDIIETFLLKNQHYEILQKYIGNRFEKNRIHSEKVNLLGTRLVTDPDYPKDELQDFSVNQIQIAANRYLQRDMETGDITESMTGWFDRVASHVVLGSVVYDPKVFTKESQVGIEPKTVRGELSLMQLTPTQIDVLSNLYKKLEINMIYDEPSFMLLVDHLLSTDKYQSLYRKYFQYMYQGIFEPNTPTLMNAGTTNGKCSACFTLGVEDNMHSIMGLNSDSAYIFQGAGGLGTNISYIRPRGANIGTTFGAATGPIELVLEIIDFITQKVKSGGKRRGANMGLMNCITGDSEVSTLHGRIPIRELVGTEPLLYCISDNNELRIRKAKAVIHSGVKKVIRIRFDDDTHLDCTPDHRIMLSNGTYKEAGKLEPFDSIMAFYKTTYNKRYHVGATVTPQYINEQILSVEYKTGKVIKQYTLDRKSDDLCTHHIDGNQLNNDPDNLEILTISEHAKMHCDNLELYRKKISDERRGKKLEEVYDEETVKKWKQNMSKSRIKKSPWNKGLKGEEYLSHYEEGIKNQFSNHKVISITELEQEQNVYDIVMDQYHNFVANSIFVHNCDHPDIEEFITMKKKPGYLENFNISVLFDSKFWEHYKSNSEYDLKHGDKVYGKINASHLMEQVAVSAWASAEPGVAFKDNANKANPLLGLKGEIDICNPCAEQFMYDGESCTLGSINLAKLVREDGTFDWDGYVRIIHETTRFLNDVLEINQYPTEHIAEESDKSKRIGLGIMGLADLFFLLKIPYNSEYGFVMMEELSKTLYIESVKASIDLAEERGSCYWYNELVKDYETILPIDSIIRNYNDVKEIHMALGTEYLEKLNKFGIRNMWTTTIAPTGTISMIADCSSGLEPIFSLVFSKITTAGKYYYTSELFKKALIDTGIYSQELLEKVEKNYGSCQGIDEIPKEIQKVFLTAMDLHWMDHVVAQSVWQNWIDNSISKTINMPYNVSVNDVKNAYILAHELGLKGIALFRDGSRNEQVLHVGSNVQSNKNEQTVQRDTPGTQTILQAPTRNQVEKNIKPSTYSMTYIKDRVNEKLMTDLTLHVGKTSTYLEKGSECPKCKVFTYIEEGGCGTCKSCGFSGCSVA
jgi:adenosylcobalamin-dependent ribonucleoside-diphosphate reductase